MMFSSFDFTLDDAVELWQVLKQVVEKFHENAENYYSNFYCVLQGNLLLIKFGGNINLRNILLLEVVNHSLMHLSTKKVYCDNSTTKHNSVKRSERELKSSQYIIGMMFTNYILSENSQKIKIVHSKQFVSILLCCKTYSDDTQTLINAKD